jgi:AraC-like DNA-binding protein
MECNEAKDTEQVHVLPDACVELFISYTEAPVAIIDQQLHKNSMVNSRMNVPTSVQMRKGAGCIAICFQPGMAYPFFSLPMSVLNNNSISLNDIWGKVITEIEDKLANANDHKARIDIIQTYLLRLLQQTKQDIQIGNCIKLIQKKSAEISLAELHEMTGYTQRHLARKFKQHVGLSPKEYLKVTRFISSLKRLKNYPKLSLTQIAYQSGYFDQAHFIHDYKIYAQHTPKEIAHSPHILY